MAVKVIEGHDRESMPSNEAFATVVDENEVQKMLGLQNYWSYGGFETGSGTGYINVANGNMAYITTERHAQDVQHPCHHKNAYGVWLGLQLQHMPDEGVRQCPS